MIATRIKTRRKQLRLTQKELAAAIGKGESTISEWESGKRHPDLLQAAKLAEKLRTTVPYLIGTSDDPEIPEASQPKGKPQPAGRLRLHHPYPLVDKRPISRQRIPLLGRIHAGEPTFEDEGYDAYVEMGSDVQCDFALRVTGDSMTGARIQDGDIVFIRQQDTVRDGEIAAVLIDDETTLKRVRYLPGKMTMLMPENSKYQPIVIGGPDETRSVRILGKAVAFQSVVR